MEEDDSIQIPMLVRVADSGDHRTILEFVIFGKHLLHVVSGDNHLPRGEALAAEWNDHFVREWGKLELTSAAIMGRFSDSLEAQGVTGVIIDTAMDAVVEYAKG